MYLKIHPFERPEHGLKHFEDEVGPTEERIEQDFGKYPEGRNETIELLDPGSVEHPEGRIEHQEHNLDHSSGDDLEDGAESKVGSRVENLETFCGIFSNRTFSGA